MVDKVIEIIESLETEPSSRINKVHIAVIVRKNEQINQISEALAKEGYTVNVVSKLSPVDLESDAIHVLTAHASKGLGFPVAIVPYVSQDIYPPSVSLSKAKDEDQMMQVMENEQRLLYVALSRASHKLFMISDQDKPSSLLKDIRSELWNKTLN